MHAIYMESNVPPCLFLLLRNLQDGIIMKNAGKRSISGMENVHFSPFYLHLIPCVVNPSCRFSRARYRNSTDSGHAQAFKGLHKKDNIYRYGPYMRTYKYTFNA